MSASAQWGVFLPLSIQIPGCQPHPQHEPFPVGLCHIPRASCSPGHQSRHPEGTHSPQAGVQGRTQPTEPALQQWWHTGRKASLQIPAGCCTAANQEKVTKQTQFCFLIWKSICLQQNYWQINSTIIFHFGSEAPMADMIELFIWISTWYIN